MAPTAPSGISKSMPFRSSTRRAACTEMIEYNVDVTERRHAMDELRTHERALERLTHQLERSNEEWLPSRPSLPTTSNRPCRPFRQRPPRWN